LVIYGFWFTSTKEEINLFLIAAITLLTLSSSALMWMHNRVMQQLSFFMKNCEQAAKDSIAAAGSTHSISLFYFYSENGGTVDRFHRHQRLLHRIVLAIILAGTNGLAIGVTWNKVGSAISAIAIVLLVLSIGILFRDLGKDDSVPNR
jgi:hypothetical protein